ncbi:MAG TPA: hypothetical protein GXX75_24460 [Clostridiales bacterium]|nr:hypothetical protein [Clostridiales bacterium]
MYNFYNSKDGYMSEEKRERKYNDGEYGVSENVFYSKKECGEDTYKDCEKEDKHKEEKNCVVINIYCDKCKKEPKKDGCKDNYKDGYKDNSGKEYEYKEGQGCVVVNIFCDKDK